MNTYSQQIRILLVEDDPDDVWVMRNLLADRWDGPIELIHVEMLSSGIERCARGEIDVILLDLSLPDSRGLETFLLMHARAGEIPIVVLTGYDDSLTAVKAVQAGAQDYLVKGQVDDNLLIRSLRYAIERNKRHRVERELQCLLVVAGVVLEPGRRLVRELIGLDEVLHPDLRRVHVQLVGGVLDEPLDHE